MQKAVVVGLSLVCVCILFAWSGPSAQRTVSGDGGASGGAGPTPVTVANFPQVQQVQLDKTVNVTGSVAVTNLPAIQQVAGSVNVGNLPLDAEGNVKVRPSLVVPVVRFIGLTNATFEAPSPFAGPLSFARACDAEFPGSRICEANEVLRSIPIVAELTESALIFLPSNPYTVQALVYCVNENGQVGSCPGGLLPVACCGY